ncbi:MAG: hypothetical protein V1744_02435 [Candidatus Altiarchaeota archaeon]
MEKERSNVVLVVMTSIVALLLVISTVLKNWEDDCYSHVDQERDIKDQLFQDYISSLLMYYEGVTLFAVKNTSAIFDDDDKIGIDYGVKMSVFWEKGFTKIDETRMNITQITKGMSDKNAECNLYSISSSIFLYAAIVMNLVSLFYATQIYRLYKT